MTSICKQSRFCEIFATHNRKEIHHMRIWKVTGVGDLREQRRELIVDHRLIYRIETIDVQWWWNHDINFMYSINGLKPSHHVKIICDKIRFIILECFGVICPQHYHVVISFAPLGVSQSLRIPVRKSPCFHHRCICYTVVMNLNSLVVENFRKKDWVRIGFRICTSVTGSYGISNKCKDDWFVNNWGSVIDECKWTNQGSN